MTKLTSEERLERKRACDAKYYEADKEKYRERQRKYQEEHRKEVLEYQCKYRGTHREERRTYRETHRREARGHRLKYAYNLSQEDYDRMFVFQGGVCAICGEAQKDRNLSVDHDHVTGKVRALLCDKCNRGLGYFNDNPASLRKAADYLERESTDEEEEEGE